MGGGQLIVTTSRTDTVKILIAGLSQQSATAVELTAKRVWSDPSFVRPPRSITNALEELSPEAMACDIGVFDLLGLGLAHWTGEQEAELQVLMAKRPSIVLLPPGGGGWLNTVRPGIYDPVPLVLQHPVLVASLHDALDALRQRHLSGPRTSSSEGRQSEPAMAHHRGQGRFGAPVAPEVYSPPLAETGQLAKVSAITGAEFEEGYFALLSACPDIVSNPYLNLICTLVMKNSPHEMRVTAQTAAVIHPTENWVSSNISTTFQHRLMHHKLMLKLVEVVELPQEALYAHSQALFGRRVDGRRPLNTFMWRLVFNTFEDCPPVAVGDIHFCLNQIADFTRLPKVPDLFLQLSLVCMRQPQSITGLQRTFLRHDPNQITLFVVCAILSGMANVLHGSRPNILPSPRPTPTPDATRKRGFFKSLLDKLF